MSDSQLTLSEYLTRVQNTIHQSFNQSVWIQAEIRNLNIKNGHYYFELSEKDQETDKVIASCKATLWKFIAVKIVAKFERESGITLSRDLNVLIKVKARFDPQYGFSLSIEEIDSSYTLGDLARRYQQILHQLEQAGLLGRNKALAAPFDLQHILVIAPENAAGLGDFQKDALSLERANLCHFVYQTATFQGNTAAKSICEALSQSLRQWAQDYHVAPDLIVIIRGGGAVNDLAYLNDFDLAALLCKRSIPIWVGIGHEKDKTILDEIAHRSFDTPSKVIAGIRHLIVERSQEVIESFQKIKLLSQHQITAYQNQNDQLLQAIRAQAQNTVNDATKAMQLCKSSTQYFVQQQIKYTYHNLESLIKQTMLQHPRSILSKGYAIVREDGKAIGSVQHIQGNKIQVQLQDGNLYADLTQVVIHEQ